MTTPDSLASCHALLKTALRAAPPEVWPPGPFALGGPCPVCSAMGQVHLGMWLASIAAGFLRDPVEQARAAQVVEAVRALLLTRKRVPMEKGHPHLVRVHRRLLALTDSGEDRSSAFSVVDFVARAAYALALGRGDAVTDRLDAAVRRVVRLLGKTPDASPMTVRDFLAELDMRILRLECSAAIAPLVPSGTVPEVAEVLWRGDGGAGRALHFIARLGDGTYGLVTKLGGRWRWVRGGRDEVLSTVPDALFPEAARAVMRG